MDKNGKILPERRNQAVFPKLREKAIPNKKSAMVWHYGSLTKEDYEDEEFETQMHRTCGSAVIKNDLLFITDFSGLVHFLNARTGRANWTYDMFAESWGTPLIVENKVYIGDSDGDIAIFPLTADPNKAIKKIKGELRPALGEIPLENAVFTTPVVANNVLFICNKNTLFAISAGGK